MQTDGEKHFKDMKEFNNSLFLREVGLICLFKTIKLADFVTYW
jgi:hypothetical protein